MVKTSMKTMNYLSASKTIQCLLIVIIVGGFCMITIQASQCVCDVRFVGEYCGLVLNQKNPANNCSADMYFCGKSNLKQEAILVKFCNQKGFECNKKLNGGNACYQNLKCHCGNDLVRKGKYCGTDLEGTDCKENIIYRCPMIRRYNASPEDACPNGCKDGKCIT